MRETKFADSDIIFQSSFYLKHSWLAQNYKTYVTIIIIIILGPFSNLLTVEIKSLLSNVFICKYEANTNKHVRSCSLKQFEVVCTCNMPVFLRN